MSTNNSPAARRGRRSSFTGAAQGAERAVLTGLQRRMLEEEQKRIAQEESKATRRASQDKGEAGVEASNNNNDAADAEAYDALTELESEPAVEDSLPENMREVLNTPPEERTNLDIDRITELLGKRVPEFFGYLTDIQQTEIARCCLYHFFTPGTVVCDEDEEVAYYFLVLKGSVMVEEPQVSMKEASRRRRRNSLDRASTESMGSQSRRGSVVMESEKHGMRLTSVGESKGFHHFPLVMQSRFNGYSAKIEDPEGASLVMIPKADYISVLRRAVEKEMTDTVTMLRATPFFSVWSEVSVARLYFWFERKRMGPEEDVVKQGDDADFCFIIRSGRCDVLVKQKDPAEEAKEKEAAERAAKEKAELEVLAEAMAAQGKGPREIEDAVKARSDQLDAIRAKEEKERKRKAMLKMASAAALKGVQAGMAGQALRADMRHVASLGAGTLVGEIALLKDGSKRMATVKTAEHCEVLMLDKKSFLDLDSETINIISENARYNAACTKEPAQRTRDDLQILQAKTATLSHLASLPSDVHLELCRVMRYRNIKGSTILVRKGQPASALYVLISGTVNTYTINPSSLMLSRSAFARVVGGALAAKKAAGAEAFEDAKVSEVVRSGQAIGEDELLKENPVHSVTAVTAESVELMEIERKDFDRILKAGRSAEKGRLIDFLSTLSMMEGTSYFAVQSLANAVSKRSFIKNQPCLAHPPSLTLGAASYHPEYVYVIFSGEARLLCSSSDVDDRPPPPPVISEEDRAKYGPLVEAAPPPPAKVYRHMGSGPFLPVATLGPGEVISDNLLKHPGAKWCLKPITALEVLVMPRKDFSDNMRSAQVATMKQISGLKAFFFDEQLKRTIKQTALRKYAEAQGRKELILLKQQQGDGESEPLPAPALSARPGGGGVMLASARSPSKKNGGGGGGGAGGVSSPVANYGSLVNTTGGNGTSSQATLARIDAPAYGEGSPRKGGGGGGDGFDGGVTARDASPFYRKSVYQAVDSPRNAGTPREGAGRDGGVTLPDISSPSRSPGGVKSQGFGGGGGGGGGNDSLPPLGTARKKKGEGAHMGDPMLNYQPVIKIHKSSQVGSRPLTMS